MKQQDLTHKQQRKQLRRVLREKRRNLGRSQQLCAEQQLARQIRRHPVFLRSKRIACYMADDGEISTASILRVAQKMGKHCYLPILHPLKENRLWFGRLRRGDVLTINYFGLEEPPAERATLKPWAIDLVLMPLVGFDRNGSRLGMGGGFYDRTFAFNKTGCRPHRPVLMGVAHSCQEIESLSVEPWDVQLDYIATEKELIRIS